MAFSGAGSIVGALIVAWLGKFKRMGLTALLVQAVYGLLIIAFAMSRVLWLSDILLFFTGAALMIVFSTVTSLVQLIAPNEMRGRVMSIYMLAFRGGMPLGSLVSGYLATYIGAPLRHRHQRRAAGRRRDLLPDSKSRSAGRMTMRIADCRRQIRGLAVQPCCAASATLVAAGARPQPGVQLPLPQIDAQMFHVSAGKRLKPTAWPNGARVAVGLSFDVDNATADLATGNLISESISRGEYGAVDGLPRILRLLDKHQLPASFFIPAVSHLLHPEMIPSILKSGRHEIGVHGWIHEHLPSVNDAAAEQDMLTRAIETLTKAIGKKPVGYRAPSWQFSPWTMKQVKDAGFLYDSSLMASDDAYEILLDKQPTGVVELPIERILDDFPYFGGATNGGMPNPDLDRAGVPVGVRRRLRGRRALHPDDAPAHHRPPVARRRPRKADRAHEVEAGRVVRDARADRALREEQHRS